ncbi:MAG: co-chaperone GroES [Fulvivirga sp.]|nr:co-chaperone GroES [Fulvivirga sp.]
MKYKRPKVDVRGDRVIVKPLENKKKTKGGILIPDTAKERPSEGIVVAVAEGLKTKEGERVLFGKTVGFPVELDEEEYLIMREADILAAVEEGEVEIYE